MVVSVVLSSSSAVQISDTVREQWVSALAARVCSPVRVMLHPRVTWSTNLASAACQHGREKQKSCGQIVSKFTEEPMNELTRLLVHSLCSRKTRN